MIRTVAVQALRMRRDRNYKDKPKKYKHTYCVVAEESGEILLCCDVVGNAASDEVTFLDADGTAQFSMKPNRKIMPTQWLIKDASGSNLGRVDQKIMGKANWVGFDAGGSEAFRIADAESRADRLGKTLLCGTTSKYNVIRNNRPYADIEKEPREKTDRKGIRGFIKAFVTPSDWVVRFHADAPDQDLRLLVPAMVLLIDITVALDSSS